MLVGKSMTTKIILFTLSLFPLCSEAQVEKTTIVFVCEHGGARSTIASVYFNKIAREHHLPFQSIFRGLVPDSAITKETKKGLFDDGFETSRLVPVALSSKDVSSKTLLITLDCEAPSSYQTYEAWQGIPAISADYAAARNSIVKLLNELVKELESNKTTSKAKNK